MHHILRPACFPHIDISEAVTSSVRLRMWGQQPALISKLKSICIQSQACIEKRVSALWNLLDFLSSAKNSAQFILLTCQSILSTTKTSAPKVCISKSVFVFSKNYTLNILYEIFCSRCEVQLLHRYTTFRVSDKKCHSKWLNKSQKQ